MKPIRRILLILDPSLSRTPALDRAEALARQCGAQLWLGLFDRGPRLGVLGVMNRAQARRLESMMRDQMSTRLRELQGQLVEGGLDVQVIDVRARAAARDMVDQASGHDIDLVIKDVAQGSALRRLVVLPLDWELLRNSPAPVWMVGPNPGGLPRRVVAAVDPVNPEHGSGPLNDAILDMATLLSRASGGHVRVFSAFAGITPVLNGLDPAAIPLGSMPEDLYESLRKEHRHALDVLLERHGLTEHDSVILYGPPAYTLLDTLEGYRAELLVVGTIRRRGVERLLMGSTVERLIGETPCDLIAVPASRSTPARSRRTGTTAS